MDATAAGLVKTLAEPSIGKSRLPSISPRGRYWFYGAIVGSIVTLAIAAIAKRLEPYLKRTRSRRILPPKRSRHPRRSSVSSAWSSTSSIDMFDTSGTSTTPNRKQRGSSLSKVAPLSVMDIADGVSNAIGNTPLIRIKSLFAATGCDILGKAEFLNPGGSTKDRVALHIVECAENNGLITPRKPQDCRDCLFEGTVGSTGISLAMIARSRGYDCHIVMPNDQAEEKHQLLEALGAQVERVKPASIVDPQHIVNLAKTRAHAFTKQHSTANNPPGYRTRVGLFCDQFETVSNFEAHYQTTGPELLHQTAGRIDAFVAGAGWCRQKNSRPVCKTILIIFVYCRNWRHARGNYPLLKATNRRTKGSIGGSQGSGLVPRVKHGVLYSPTEKEGTRKRHQTDTIVEGIGINRITRNFALIVQPGWIDDAVRVTDEEAVEMSRFLVERGWWVLPVRRCIVVPGTRLMVWSCLGLFLGSSSAVNCVAALKTAQKLGPGHTIVTILCDGGQRHLSKFWQVAECWDSVVATATY